MPSVNLAIGALPRRSRSEIAPIGLAVGDDAVANGGRRPGPAPSPCHPRRAPRRRRIAHRRAGQHVAEDEAGRPPARPRPRLARCRASRSAVAAGKPQGGDVPEGIPGGADRTRTACRRPAERERRRPTSTWASAADGQRAPGGCRPRRRAAGPRRRTTTSASRVGARAGAARRRSRRARPGSSAASPANPSNRRTWTTGAARAALQHARPRRSGGAPRGCGSGPAASYRQRMLSPVGSRVTSAGRVAASTMRSVELQPHVGPEVEVARPGAHARCRRPARPPRRSGPRCANTATATPLVTVTSAHPGVAARVVPGLLAGQRVERAHPVRRTPTSTRPLSTTVAGQRLGVRRPRLARRRRPAPPRGRRPVQRSCSRSPRRPNPARAGSRRRSSATVAAIHTSTRSGGR